MSDKKPSKKKPTSKTPNKTNSSSKKDIQSLNKTVLASNHFSKQKKPKLKKLKKQVKTKLPTSYSVLSRIKHWLINLFKKIKAYKTKRSNSKNIRQPLPPSFKKHNPWYKRFLKYIFSLKGLFLFIKLGILVVIIMISAVIIIYLHYRSDIPNNIDSLQSCLEGQTTKYYDRTGKVLLWSSKSDIDCQPIQSTDVSKNLINALIVMEDQDFYEHAGFEITAITRAIINNLRNEDNLQGGSTITQQYIKNAILKDSSRNFSRKFKELVISIELERTFTKDEILTAYLNTVSFGSIYSGIEAASQGYFGKPAKDLTIDESALLVAALPAPTTYWDNRELHQERRNLVLNNLYNHKYITKAEYDTAYNTDTFQKVITSHKQYENIIAPHFILEAEKRLIQAVCDEAGQTIDQECKNVRLKGYKVITTLDMKAQELAQKSVDDVIPTIIDKGFDNAASVAVDVETGKVIALVGSRDFDYPKFGQTNTVTQKRDSGSTFKIFDYGALIENTTNWGAGSIFYDYETTFDDRNWTPPNYSGNFAGPITMRRALGQSLNIPAIKAMHIAGVDTVHEFAEDAGIRSKITCLDVCGLATSFASAVRLDELTNAYATFSRSGTYLPLTYIDRVEALDGTTILKWQKEPERVFNSETAYLLNNMLSDKSVRYTQAFNLDPQAQTTMAVKTGTDDNFINNHIVSYTKSVAFGAWIGNHDETVTFETERYTSPPKALMIKTFMEAYHRNTPFEKRNSWKRPSGIKEIKIDLLTGYQASGNATRTNLNAEPIIQTTAKDIFPSWYVPKIINANNEVKTVDRASGQLASACTPDQSKYTGSTIEILNELSHDDPYYYNWQIAITKGLREQFNFIAFTGGQDSLHNCDDLKPKIEIINQPSVCSNNCEIEFRIIQGDFKVDQLIISHDGAVLIDGSIDLDITKQTQDVKYVYKPLELNSDVNIRGKLTARVIDQALYSETIDVFLNIQGFPDVSQTNADINLSGDIDNDLQLLNLYWNKPYDDLFINLDQCSNLDSQLAPVNQNSISIYIGFNQPGQCLIYLEYDGQKSNTLELEIPKFTQQI